jgi:hypothetical protein
MCGALRNFKHLGYPGGCRDCRARGKVYGEDGIQLCGHYDAFTEDAALAWQKDSNSELCKLFVPEDVVDGVDVDYVETGSAISLRCA